MTDAVLFVLSEPGTVAEPEFHRWYDHHHGPARMAVPGVRSGRRYRALDGARPSWLAWYETDTEVLAGERYRRLREHRDADERRIMAGLSTLDRRVYELLETYGRPVPHAPVLVCTSLSTRDEPGLATWYREEHIPRLSAIPGWWRTRRYRLVAGRGPALLALHEISGTDLFDTEAYRAATSGARRDAVMRSVTARERRVFGYHNTLGPDGPADPPPA